MTTYELYKVVHSAEDKTYTDILNALEAYGFPPADAKDLLYSMKTAGHLSGELSAFCHLSLTPSGVRHLYDLLEQRYQRADERAYISSENRKQRKTDWLIGISCGLGGILVGFLLNLIIMR